MLRLARVKRRLFTASTNLFLKYVHDSKNKSFHQYELITADAAVLYILESKAAGLSNFFQAHLLLFPILNSKSWNGI